MTNDILCWIAQSPLSVMQADDLIKIGVSLANHTKLPDLKSSIDSLVRSLGFDYFSVVAHDFQTFNQDEVFFTHNYPKQWEEHYFAHNYFEIDPANSADSGGQPIFKWATSSSSEVITSASEFGICSGITVPVIEPGSKGFASYASSAKNVDADMEVHAYFVSPYIYSAVVKVIKFGAQREEYSLTKREIECLKWVCDGKTSWEISKILDISERTVLFHLTNIQKKLNTTNRLQSVAKSIVIGLITP